MTTRYSIRADRDGNITVLVPDQRDTTPEIEMEINETLAQALAKVAFGATARVRVIASSNDPNTKYRIAYLPEGTETPTVVGYGASWNEALQKAFISERGQQRIAEANDGSKFSYVANDPDSMGSGLAYVQVKNGGDVYQFDYEGMNPAWLDTHPRNEVPITDLPHAVVPNAIAATKTTTPEKKVSTATVESPLPTTPRASAAKTSVPRAYVNPNNIKTGLLGWDSEVTPAAVLAAITGEHLLVVGPPGNAKSLFARRFFANFEGKLFETQLSKYSDETALFGAPNLKRLREDGVFEYPKHGLAAADWGFLDEIFDSSDVLLRTMLGVLQEKKFTKGGHEEDIPLQTVIATANYTRVNEITAAVVDRFAFSVASPTLTPAQREMLYGSQTFEDVPRPTNIVGIDQLKTMRANAKTVEIPGTIIKALVSWTTEMGFTPRRERKLAAIIRASAALNGRKRADENDIMAARFCVPISNSGKVEDAAKSLQPLKDAILQALHEGEQLAALGKMAQAVDARSQSPQDLIACIKGSKVKLAELRAFNAVSEKVNKQREAAIGIHEAMIDACTKALDI